MSTCPIPVSSVAQAAANQRLMEDVKFALDKGLPLHGGSPKRASNGSVSITIERVIADEVKTLTVEADYFIEEPAERETRGYGGNVDHPGYAAVVSLGVIRDDQDRVHYLAPHEFDELEEKAKEAASK